MTLKASVRVGMEHIKNYGGKKMADDSTMAAGIPEEIAATPEPVIESEKEPEPEKKYTDSDVDEIVKKRLARERNEWESKLAKATEAEKLKGMNDLERANHECERLEKENAALIEQINLSQQMDVARADIRDAGIKDFPDELLKNFVSPDASKTKDSLDVLIPYWKTYFDAALKDALKQQPPKSPNPTSNTPSAGKSFAEAYNERMQGR